MAHLFIRQRLGSLLVALALWSMFIGPAAAAQGTPDKRFETDNAADPTMVMPAYSALDNDDPAAWLRYAEGPRGFWINDAYERVNDESAPSGDQTVMHVGVQSSSPYANVYRYQSRPLTSGTQYVYTTRFKWASGDVSPQALEFPFSIYTGSQRLEAAMQWVANDGQGQRWRVWGGADAGYWTDGKPDGTTWNFLQTLTPDEWHSFTMNVSIEHNTITYHSVTVDGQTFAINTSYHGVADATPAQTVIAFQIDNNYAGSRQDVWLDGFSLSWNR
ncbi:MAG: hypothetical protein NVS2B7_19070 [Herpetosiphon sp.]